jgi:hypothetical protein
VPLPDELPERRGRVGDHELGRFHRVFGPEVVEALRLAGDVDEERHTLLRRPGVPVAQRGQRIGCQPAERQPPARPLLRGDAPVSCDVRTCSGESGEVADLPQHGVRVGRLGRRAFACCVLGGIQLAFDALAQLRRASPVQVPQGLLDLVLVETCELGEELVAVHPVQGHGSRC